MRYVVILATVLVALGACKKNNESVPEYYVAMNIGSERIVLTEIDMSQAQAPLLLTFSARDKGNRHRINFAVTNTTPGAYPQYVDTTAPPDFSQRYWIDCGYIAAGGNWHFLRPIAGKEAGVFTITVSDDRMVSGSFHAWVGTAENALELTDGTFRVKTP